MKAFSPNLIKTALVLVPLFSSYLLFGDGGATVPCEYTSEYQAQKAKLTAQQFNLIEYSIDCTVIPLTNDQKVRYNNNTDWVTMSDLSSYSSYQSTVDEANTKITGIKLINATRHIYLEFEATE